MYGIDIRSFRQGDANSFTISLNEIEDGSGWTVAVRGIPPGPFDVVADLLASEGSGREEIESWLASDEGAGALADSVGEAAVQYGHHIDCGGLQVAIAEASGG